MTAEEAVSWIESARYTAVKVGLENTRALLKKLGNPEKKVKCAHVAGTNGKGSVCAVMESVLRTSGYKTGLYTSPYLMRYNERIQINGMPISDEDLVRHTVEVKKVCDELTKEGVKPSAFEIGTAVAFCAYAQQGVDIAVIETGLGGRFDPTNVILPEVCAIASIGLDHMSILGDTLEKIAGEKAGILKPDTPAAIYPAPEGVIEVFKNAADRVRAPLYFAEDCDFIDLKRGMFGSSFSLNLPEFGVTNAEVRLPGAHQEQNARLAILTLSLLAKKGFHITNESVSIGAASARWPGRLEWVNDEILLDGAHNVDGALALSEYLNAYLKDRRVVLLTGMMSDKRPEAYAKIIANHVSQVVTTKVDWDRAVKADALADIYISYDVDAVCVNGIENALERAMSLRGENGVILVAGSLYLVGAVRRILVG